MLEGRGGISIAGGAGSASSPVSIRCWPQGSTITFAGPRRVLAGERDEDALAAGLDDIDRAILGKILAGIAEAAGGRDVGD